MTPRALALAACLGVAACSDTTAPRNGFTPFAGFVSNPVTPASSVQVAGSRATLAASVGRVDADSLAYVAASPGTLNEALSVTIANARTGGAATVAVKEGGFDAVAIPAATGDTLDISITGPGGVSLAKSIVPAHRPPRVVRTSPAGGRTDVAINASVVVMFSEPVAAGTLDPSSVQLTTGSAAVSGKVRAIGAPAIGAEFVPDAPLAAATVYHLVLTQRIADLSGEPLADPPTVNFTTSASSPPIPDQGATQLSFFAQPSTFAAGLEIWPAVQVIARNAEGGQVVDFSGPVTLSLATNPAGATLGGQLTVWAAGGIATFSHATVSDPGSDFTLQATSPGLAAGTSAAFDGVPAGCCGTVSASFSLIEYQDPLSGIWSYAPQVHLIETSAQGAVFVPELAFTIPGVGAAPICLSNLEVGPGASVDVFHEIYGDYALTIGQTGYRATSATATMRVLYRDTAGRVDSLDVNGPIVPGSLPNTYTGGPVQYLVVACGL